MNSPGRYIVPLTIAACFIYLIIKVHEILLPFVLGATLAYLLSPLVRFIEIHGLRRTLAVFLVFGGVFVAFLVMGYLVFAHMSQEAARAGSELPRYVERGQKFLEEIQKWNRGEASGDHFAWVRRFVDIPDVGSYVTSHWRTLPGVLMHNGATLASHVLPVLEMLALVPLIAFLVMLEAPDFLEAILSIVPPPYVEMTLNIIFEVDNSLGNYVRGLLVKALLIGVVTWIGFWAIGLDYAVQLSILSGLANVVPLVGPLAAGAFACGVAVFQMGTIAAVAKVIAINGLIRILDDGFLQIVVFKNSVELHPILMLFSLMAGGFLWGVWGMFFAVPLACMAKVLLHVIWQWYRSEYGLRYDATPAEVSHIPLI